MRVFVLQNTRRKVLNSIFRYFCKFSLWFFLFFIGVIVFSMVYMGISVFWRSTVMVDRDKIPDLHDIRQIKSVVRNLDSNIELSKSVYIYGEDSINVVGDKVELPVFIGKTQRKNQNIQNLYDKGVIQDKWNKNFLFNNISRNPDEAGIWGAFVGSCLIAVVILIFLIFVGCGSGIYFAVLAPPNSFLVLCMESLVKNLASMPSIIVGFLFGKIILINFLGFATASPLVIGLVLGMMVLPTVIVNTKIAILSIPSGVKLNAMYLGASRIQVLCHHLLPLALSSMLRGVLISLGRCLGETAALMPIGVQSFITSNPSVLVTSATPVLASQIIFWAFSPEPRFMTLAAAGIVVLLFLVFIVNILSFFLTKRLGRSVNE